LTLGSGQNRRSSNIKNENSDLNLKYTESIVEHDEELK
jgi:hypothetical protein